MLTDNVIFSFLLRFCKPFWKILLHRILGKGTGSSNFWWSRKVRFPYDLIHACIRQRENLLICSSPQSMFFNDREVSQTLLENKITLLFKSCGLEASRIRVVVFEGVANPSVECTYTSKLLDKAIWLFKRICMLSKYPKQKRKKEKKILFVNIRLGLWIEESVNNNTQKQLSRVFLRKRCSENIEQIYRRTPMPKYDLNKVPFPWNHISALAFSCKFAAYFQNTSS